MCSAFRPSKNSKYFWESHNFTTYIRQCRRKSFFTNCYHARFMNDYLYTIPIKMCGFYFSLLPICKFCNHTEKLLLINIFYMK